MYDSRVMWNNSHLHRQLKLLNIIPRILGLAPYSVTTACLQPYSTKFGIYTVSWITFYLVMFYIEITYNGYTDRPASQFRKLTLIIPMFAVITNVLWAFLRRDLFAETWKFINEYDKLTKYHLRAKSFTNNLWCILYFISALWLYPTYLQLTEISSALNSVGVILSLVSDYTVIIGTCKFAIETHLIGLRIHDLNNIILSGAIRNYAQGPFLTFREIRHLYVILMSANENLAESHSPQLFAWIFCSFCSTIMRMFLVFVFKFIKDFTTKVLVIIVQIVATYIFCKICDFNISEAKRMIVSLYSKIREPAFFMEVGKERLETELYMILMEPQFSAIGLFNVNCSLFCSMMTESVTYLVLLIQHY